ncbi:MAG: SxtJ family membrane protein [Bryobacteraceae bacterium]
MGSNFHEDLRAHSELRGGSDRQFGLVFAGVCAVVALWPLRAGEAVRWPALVLAALFLAAAVGRPSLLGPLNRLWMQFGLLLGRIVNPIVTAVLFFVVFTPAGLLLRALGKDPLRLKRAPQATTYWIPREPAGAPRDTLAKQF